MYDAPPTPMHQLLSRWRYELLALGVSLVFAAAHVLVEGQPTVGLLADGAQGSTVVRAVQLLEGRAADLKFRLRGPRPPHPDLVVVAIDERSAQRYGLWPWPRDLFARGLERLLDGGARAVGLDIAFTDQAHDEGAAWRDALAAFDAAGGAKDDAAAKLREAVAARAGTSPDLALETVFRKGGSRVIQGVFTYSAAEAKDFSAEKIAEQARILGPAVTFKIPGKVPGSFFDVPVDQVQCVSQQSAQTPLPAFAAAGSRLGHLSFTPDVDGSGRRTPLLVRLASPRGFLPSLAAQTAAAYLDAQALPAYEDGLLTGVTLKGEGVSRFVPFQNNEPFALINHVGPAERFALLSMRDVIEGSFDPAAVRGKAVLVGVTLSGLAGDQRVTPFKELEPGIFTHASVLSSILEERYLARPLGLMLGEAALMVLLALALARALPRLRSFAAKLGLILSLAAAWVAFDAALFAGGVVVATVLPLAQLLTTSFGLIFLGYVSVDREKLKLRSTFSRYLGEDVMEEALKNPDKLNRGEKREMTVLFSDIRGFTTLSERMVPEKLASFINEYLSPMTQIVFEEKGTLDKYIGDAIMAFWNAPIDQEDHALRACAASLRMLEKLQELKERWRKENFPEFDIGVGVNTGPMIVGNMGSDVRVDYTVMGDAVNLASRLEGTNKEYDTRIILGEGTWDKVAGKVTGRRLGAVRVKGKRKPVRIYELRGMGPPQGAEKDATEAFDRGLDAYTRQAWDEAEAEFRKVLELWKDDTPARRYLEEIETLRAHPPGPGWDGVYTATTK